MMKRTKVVDPTRRAEFLRIYERELRDGIAANPSAYAYGPDMVPTVMTRVDKALTVGNYNKDQPSFRRTCKQLGIKHTYAAIASYLAGTEG